MQVAHLDLEVVQSMVYVYNADLAKPFNNWSKVAVAQGFSWREGCVGFGTFVDMDPASLSTTVHVGEDGSSAEAQRVIRVPFAVSAGGAVSITGIYEQPSRRVEIAPGSYDLLFALTAGRPPSDEAPATLSATLSFVPGSSPPAILRADDELDPPAAFDMSARPA